MAITTGQLQVTSPYRNLLMGTGTRFDLQSTVNPFIRGVRAEQTGARAWEHGSYSGAEWQAEAVVPIRVIARGADADLPSTRAAIQDMAAAFAAVGATGETIELHFFLDGDDTEYVMLGTTRGFEPDLSTIAHGYVYAAASFVAQDPRYYTADLQTASTGLPLQQGGLMVPMTVPAMVEGVLVSGEISLVNTGTTNTWITVRLSGPVPEPGFLLELPGGVAQSVRFDLDLAAGQWIDIDSRNGTALLNGLASSTQRGRAAWDLDRYPIPPGTTKFRFTGADYFAAAQATVTHYPAAYW